MGDITPSGACESKSRCIEQCACGDTDCYDRCPESVGCTASLFALRDCEAVQCATECRAALEGATSPCIELLHCCESPRMPEGFVTSCRNGAAAGIVESCESVHEQYRTVYGYCD